MNTNNRRWLYVLFFLFSLSGFSGLIYESIWSHYLKLFLGHAAYAQALVLTIFMGGMAGGAGLVGRYIDRIRDPLLFYVKVELFIGFFGLVFHWIFSATTEAMLDFVLPGIETVWLASALRWMMASLLILPQSLLLGATFPLISAGMIRAFPEQPGRSIALLYFTNSIGAVFGVLFCGFILIGAVGLPGTVYTAAAVNFLLALAVFAVKSRLSLPSLRPQLLARGGGALSSGAATLLMVSLLTGLSSFIYEIGWIRMLSLVLGASTHAFELMLSAFILGLALGGLWIRHRLDGNDNPERLLGWIQLLMGLAALLTVILYNSLFDFMQLVMAALQRNMAGYLFFNLSSHFVALLVMLPATFMAGMTLPLITSVLFRRGMGESAIGKVYAFNTVGAILGVWLTMWLLMPVLGLKATIITGATIDLLLALYLLVRSGASLNVQRVVIVSCLAIVILIAGRVHFDPARMVSAVFRHGSGSMPGAKILFHRDGRTATVDVYKVEDQQTISTNGKPDAALYMGEKQLISSDEPTMVMMGALPLLYMPKAETAAVIGMGAGVSAHTLLSSPHIKKLDVIEIEPAMVEGARFFKKKSSRVFSDARSNIHIEDAKSYLAAHQSHYDLIVSEPSNPWVSGVSSLFTDEFYARTKSHLNKDGLLVQWLHTYEADPFIIASILKAIEKNFPDYAIYGSNNSDIVIVAAKDGKLPELSADMFSVPAYKSDMRLMGWGGLADVEAHFMVDRSMLFAWLKSVGVKANSDFHPYLDLHAAASRFVGNSFTFFLDVADKDIPLPGAFFYEPPVVETEPRPELLRSAVNIFQAQRMAEQLVRPQHEKGQLSESNERLLAFLRGEHDCKGEAEQVEWRRAAITAMSLMLPRVNAATARQVLLRLSQTACRDALDQQWLGLFEAVADRNLEGQGKIAEGILSLGSPVTAQEANYLLVTAMLARTVAGQYEQAMTLFQQSPAPSATMVLLYAHASLGDQIAKSLRHSRGLP